MARAKRKKLWSQTVTESGVEVRIFERERGGNLHVSMKGKRRQSASGKWYTAKSSTPLGHADRTLAEKEARATAKLQAERELRGYTGAITFGQLRTQYMLHKGPMLTATRKRTVEGALGLLSRHLGDTFAVEDFGAHEAESYTAARQAGRLRPDDYRAKKCAQPGTIRNELAIFSTVCNWGARRRANGKTLLSRNPVKGIKLPEELNPRRPRVDVERYRKLAAVALEVDATGQFGMMLDLAWMTGRRINAICHLRASDVLLTPDALVRAFAEDGQDAEIAEHWAAGLRWRAEWDKKGFLTFSPFPTALHGALTAYMKDQGVIGDGWLFLHDCKDTGCRVMKARADYLLRKAEKAAGLPHMQRGGWHAMRRGWATLRKSLPLPDVMLAGGWRDPDALQKAYQGADSKTTADVVNLTA